MDQKKVIVDIPVASIIRVIVALGLVGLLLLVKDLVILIVLSFIFATSVRPLVDRLNKKKVPRSLSILLIYGGIVSILFFIFRTIIPPVISQISNIVANKGYYIGVTKGYVEKLPFLDDGQITTFLDRLIDGAGNVAAGGALSGALGIFSGVFGVVTVLILSFYFLLEKKNIEGAIPLYFSKEHSKRLVRVYRDISRKMTYWFWGQLGVATIIGILSYVGLLILGVKYALTLALIAGVTAVIPIIGPFIGAAAAIGVALTISPSKALAVAILYLIIQLLESNFITPMVMKKALGVSPVIIIIALLLGGKLFGFIGIILALPLAAVISVIIDELYKINKEEVKKIGN